MIILDTSNAGIEGLVTHRVGNKGHEEPLLLSEAQSEIGEESMEYLMTFFLGAFEPVGFHHFTHPVELELNEVYKIVSSMFAHETSILDGSRSLAKMLYEHTNHPKIKSGNFNVSYFNNLVLGDEVVDAVGIFKSETNVPFIEMEYSDTRFSLQHQFGFELEGMDKGCLVFNTGKTAGYQVLVFDKTNRALDTKYWLQDFLQLIPSADEYYNTKEFLNLTKKYVTQGIEKDMDVSKTEKIDMLNKSVEYFKQKDTFDKQEFVESVFEKEEQKASFHNFQQQFFAEKKVPVADAFPISEQAVKSQSRVFKSVLKLDKNFSVYIHGDKNLIERGVDPDGRKYYKLYFEEEK